MAFTQPDLNSDILNRIEKQNTVSSAIEKGVQKETLEGAERALAALGLKVEFPKFSKKIDTSKLPHYVDAGNIATDALTEEQIQELYKNAQNFLNNFPEEKENQELLKVILLGEKEWIEGLKKIGKYNERSLKKYYGYLDKFANKEMIGLRIRNIKKYAPDFYQKLYDNEYPIFKEINILIKLDKEIAELDKEIAELDKEKAESDAKNAKARKILELIGG